MTVPVAAASHLNAARRARELETLGSGEPVDVLVIGGGVTGAGVALDAVTRGLSVALIERRDLATGTSRWSSKLAHGGLRYLAQGDLPIAWESARERHRLMTHIAPHLIRGLPQVTPAYADQPGAQQLLMRTGIRFGDLLRTAAGTDHRRLPAMRRIEATELRSWAPALSAAGLRGGLLHWDGQLEDDARLVVAIARTAAAHGARILTYVEALRVGDTGVEARDTLSGETLTLRARHVVNATGVWAGELVSGITLRPSRGSHVLVPAARLGYPRAAVNVPLPGHFGRFVFLIPRSDGLVMIGLTDDPHEGAPVDVPVPTAADEEFLLSSASAVLARPLTSEDVAGRFAGLRPLVVAAGGHDDGEGGGRTADLSRRHVVSEDPASGVITVVGGKLTTYRRMAEDGVDAIAARTGVDAAPCRTTTLPLVGAAGVNGDPAPRSLPERLVRRFGSEAAEIAALAGERPELLRPVAPGVPVLGVELLAAVEREGALSAEDVLDIRTRAGLIPEWRLAVEAALEQLRPELARVPA